MRSNFTVWHNAGHKVSGVFGRQAIPMVWDFPEGNPFSASSGNLISQADWVARVIERLPANVNTGEAHQADATTTIYADNGPVIVTDPPYYDNIGYGDLSDFFYVWLRPLLRDIYPDLFAGILTPKNEEMIASQFRFEEPRDRFEHLLGETLRLIRERCSPEFPSSIFYAYKQQEEQREGRTSTGWETMLTALVDAGFHIVGTWPMRTELTGNLKKNVNALATSVVLVCRPRPDDAPVATRREFLDALERDLPNALTHLTRDGHIAPVDLAQAAIGPGMEIYSQYSRVETISGEPVPVREALAEINRVVDEFHRQESGELDAPSRFCLDWHEEHGFADGRYGEAETLAQANNVAVESMTDLLTAGQGIVRLLGMDDYGPDRPLSLGGITAWEGCFRMARHMDPNREDGDTVRGAGAIARAMGSDAESVERLARILYQRYDRRNDAGRAALFNNLVTSWPQIIEESLREERAMLL